MEKMALNCYFILKATMIIYLISSYTFYKLQGSFMNRTFLARVLAVVGYGARSSGMRTVEQELQQQEQARLDSAGASTRNAA